MGEAQSAVLTAPLAPPEAARVRELIRVLGIIPGLRALLFLVAGIWMLVAMVIAVRQALDYTSTWRAIGVCVIGWVVQLLILTVALSIVGAL